MSRLIVLTAFASALAAVACGAAPPKAEPVRPPTPRAAPPTELETMVETHCAMCHDGSAGQPKPLDVRRNPDVALLAALKVSANQMPPPPAHLERAERDKVIRELCKVSVADATRCVTMLTPDSDVAFAINAKTLVRALDAVAKRPEKAEPSVLEQQLAQQAAPPPNLPPAHVTKLDPTVLSLLALIATERCPSPEKGPEAARKFEECANAMLDRNLLEFPQPKASQQ